MADTAVTKPPVTNIIIKSIACNSGPYQPKLPKPLKGIKALGSLKKELIQPTSDCSDGDEQDTHTRAELFFDGMALSIIFHDKEASYSFIEGASFSHSRWNRISPIAIGSSITDLLKKEGISTPPPKNAIVSACSSDEGAPDCINITLKELIIIKTEYECYTG